MLRRRRRVTGYSRRYTVALALVVALLGGAGVVTAILLPRTTQGPTVTPPPGSPAGVPPD